MKTFLKHLLIFFYLLAFMMLFQSCVVYHKTPVTIEHAANEKIKTRIILKDKSIEKFKYITYENQGYFGTRVTGNGPVTIPIDVNNVYEVHIKNKTGSILLTAIPLAGMAALFTAAIIGWQ